MFNKPLLMAFAKKVEVSKHELTFVASRARESVNLFTDVSDSIHSPEFFTVFVNGEETEQVFTSLTFAYGDEVMIVCSGENGFPKVSFNYQNRCVKSASVLPYMTDSYGEPISALNRALSYCEFTSIPEGFFDNNTKLTDFSNVFRSSFLGSIPKGLFNNFPDATSFSSTFDSTSVTSIPEGLFEKNAKVTSFSGTFYGCEVTSIPEGLFDNNTKVTNFSSTFMDCKITSIPEGLFENNAEVTDFSYTFGGCSQLSGRVKIGSPVVTNANNFCKSTGAITVIVPAGSTTETTFRAYAETVTNLTVETF